MSLITSNLDHALSYAYTKASEYGVPMEIYSRPLFYSVDIDDDSDISDLQYIATPNISDEMPDHWTLEVVIGIQVVEAA
jgi:hypothetical protein